MNVRSALLGLFLALTIVLASTTVYEAGNRTTLTSTSTSTKTLTLFSSVLLGNTALVLNSSDGLGLSLQVEPSSNGNYTITVRESNLLDSVNNVTEANEWAYPQGSLSPYSPCGPGAPTPVGFAVVQGRYGQDNYTSGEALYLYNTGDLYPCGTLVFLGSPNTYAFQPMNDSFSFYSGSTVAYSGEASVSISTSGYWTGGQDDVAAAFRPFPPGAYTIIGADEWGDVVLLQAFLE